MPMNKNSTPLLKYVDLQGFTTDVVSDAFGIDSALNELLPSSEDFLDGPSDRLMTALFDKISHDAKVQ